MYERFRPAGLDDLKDGHQVSSGEEPGQSMLVSDEDSTDVVLLESRQQLVMSVPGETVTTSVNITSPLKR